MSKSIRFSSQAFVKLQLHLAKYPHYAVNGLLLACKHQYEDEKEKVLDFVDCIPLFHQALQLKPMLEIALMHVEEHCKLNDLIIAGYYEAPENLSAGAEPSKFGIRVGEKIHQNFKDACFFVVDNHKIPHEDCLHIYDILPDRRTKPFSGEAEFAENLNEIVDHLLNHNIEHELIDFDTHLDDVSKHWLNHAINRLIVMT